MVNEAALAPFGYDHTDLRPLPAVWSQLASTGIVGTSMLAGVPMINITGLIHTRTEAEVSSGPRQEYRVCVAHFIADCSNYCRSDGFAF